MSEEFGEWLRKVGKTATGVAALVVFLAVGVALLVVFGVVALWIVILYAVVAAALLVRRYFRTRFGWWGGPPASANARPAADDRPGPVKTIDVEAEVEYVDDVKELEESGGGAGRRSDTAHK